MRAMPLATALAGLLLAAATPVLAAGERGFSADDLAGIERVSDPQPSPDGRYLAYVQRETDLAANRGRTDLWLVDLDRPEAAPRRLTTHEANDQAPRWAPDAEALYFLSARSGTQQVWRLPLAGGEPVQVTSFPVAVDTFQLSPRGDRLAFSARVFRDCGADLGCTRERLDAAAKSPATGRIYDQLFVRHWDSWWDGRRNVLFSVPLAETGVAAGPPVALSGSLDANVPSTPFGSASEYDFSPDGARVAFAARVAGREEAWSTNLDIYEVDASGGTPVNLTPDNPATDTEPAYSPDGRYLAWRAMARAGFEADRYALRIRDRASGRLGELAPGWDRSPGHLAWAPDSKSLYVTANELGDGPLFRIGPLAGDTRVVRLTGDGTVAAFAPTRGGRVAYLLQSLGSPPQLHVLGERGGGTGSRQLTRAGAALLADVRMAEYEQFSFAGAGGATVYGYVMKPWNFEAGRRYPVAFIVHGGPQSSFADNWSFRWNPQVYAGAGYAVVFIDFHGSTGYGQAFTDSISGDWGGKPLEDLQLGLAAAAERYPWLDAGNACAMGASYGGYMVNWIAGRWPDGFRCLVNHAGIFDSRSMYYMTEELWFPEWENGGPYFRVPDDHERWNPAAHVGRWQTPMLVLHGQLDFRVPYSQGIATFTALQRRGIESRLVVYPDENHWILKPANSLQWHREVLGWLERHLARR